MNEDPERDPETAEPAGDGLSDETVAADRTIVAPRRADDETVFAPRRAVDETVVATRNEPGGEGAEPETDPVPAPVPESDRVERPLAASRPDGRAADRRGLDPARPIPPSPGTSPWEALPAGERGVTRGLPVSYGARPRTAAGAVHGPDEVQRRVGPAPQGEPRAVRDDRDALPSLARRDRRRRRATLVLYAATALLSLLGLWGVAALAFGW